MTCSSLTTAILLLAQFLVPHLSVAQSSLPQPCQSQDCLRTQQQLLLNQLNAPDDHGKIMNLDDPRIPSLLKQGWQLAGEWAAAYLNAHSSPSKSELANIFSGFAPPPSATKSQNGDFIEYYDYSFSGRPTKIS